jgi:DNA-directed RNA polymerase sigma subunit (sigma70/sigma32)
MTPREELVYKLLNEGMVYRLIGEQLGVTRERARQIYCKCLRKIAKKAREQ